MPKILETDIGEIEFPDEFTVDQLNEWGRTELPRLRERVNKGVVSDLASRFPRDVAVAGADTIMGAARGWQQFLDAGKVSGIRQMGALAALEAPVGEENAAIEAANAAADAKAKELEATREQRLAANPVYKFGEDSKKNALEFYQTNPTREGSIPAMLSQGVASTVPMIAAAATGPVAPLVAGVTYGAMAGQQGAMEAIEMGHPDKADEAFLLFAGLGALSEAALGYPIAFLRKVAQARRAGVAPEQFGQAVKSSVRAIGGRTVREALEGFGRESLQEGTEQAGQNVVASDIVGYDPDRPLMQNVPQSAAIGGVVGAGVGGVGGAAMAIDEARARARVPAMLQATIETPATPEQRAAEAAGLPIPLISPTQLSAEQSAAEQAAIVADIQRRMSVPPAEFTAPEMTDQPRPFAPAPPAAEPPRFQPPTPAQPAPQRRRSPAPQPESERPRFRPPGGFRRQAITVSIPSPSTEEAKMDMPAENAQLGYTPPLPGPPEATTPVVPEAQQKGVAPTPQPRDPNAIPIGSSATLPVQTPPEARQEVVPEVRQPERPAAPQTQTPQAQGTVEDATQVLLSDMERIPGNRFKSLTTAKPANKISKTESSVLANLPNELPLGYISNALVFSDAVRQLSKPEHAALIKLVRRGALAIEKRSAGGKTDYVLVKRDTQEQAQAEAKYSVTLQDAPQAQVSIDDIERAFPRSQGFLFRPAFDRPNSWVVMLPNFSAILIDPNHDVIEFNVAKAAAAWGIDPEIVAKYGVVKGRFTGIKGARKIGLIELLNTAGPDVLSHEKFHALFWMALNPTERDAILNRYQTEEKAAEAFRRSEGFTRSFWETMRRFLERLINLFRGDVFKPLRSRIRPDPALNRMVDAFMSGDTTKRVQESPPEPQYSLETILRDRTTFENFLARPVISKEEAASLRQQAGAGAGLVPDAIAQEIESLNPEDTVEGRMASRLNFVLQLHRVAPALELQRILADTNIAEDVKQAAISNVLRQIEHVRVKTNELEDKLQEANKKLANALKQGGKITKEKLVEARAKQIADNLITGYRAYLTAQAANLPANQNLAAARMERINALQASITQEEKLPDQSRRAIEAIAERIDELPVSEGPQAVIDAIRSKGILKGKVSDTFIDLLTADIGGFQPLLLNPTANQMLTELAALQKKAETYAKQIEVVEQAFRKEGELTPVELRKFADVYRKFRNKQTEAAKAIREHDKEFQKADEDMQVYGRSHDVLTRLQQSPEFQRQMETLLARPGGEILRDIYQTERDEDDLTKETVFLSPLTQKPYRVHLAPTRQADNDTLRDMDALKADIDEFLKGENIDPLDRRTWEIRRAYIEQYQLHPQYLQEQAGGTWTNPFQWGRVLFGGLTSSLRAELESLGIRASQEADTQVRVAEQAAIGYKLLANNKEFGDAATVVATVEAVKSHGWPTTRILHWNKYVLNPILASGQTAGQMRLKAGDYIPGTDIQITPQDMAVARMEKRFSSGIVQTTQGTAKNLPSLLRNNPVLITDAFSGKAVLRGAMSPGPFTMARSFSTWGRQFDVEWSKATTPEAQRQLVNDGDNFQMAALGFVRTTNPEFENTSPLVRVYEQYAKNAKDNNQYSANSFDQLVDHLADIAVAQKRYQTKEEAKLKIEEILMEDIGKHVAAIRAQFAEDKINPQVHQTVMQYASAQNAFTKARKKMVAPDPYYDYTLTHESDRISFVGAGFQQFQLRIIASLEALQTALGIQQTKWDAEISDLYSRGGTEAEARAKVNKKTVRQIGEVRFSYEQLIDYKRRLDKLIKQMKELVIDVRNPNDSLLLQAVTRFHQTLSSGLLANPTAIGNNLAGGIMSAKQVTLRNLGQAQSFWDVKAHARMAGAAVTSLLRIFPGTTAIGKLAKSNLPIVEDLSGWVHDMLLEQIRQEADAEAFGLRTTTDLRNRSRARGELMTTAGQIEYDKPGRVAGAVNVLGSLPVVRQSLAQLRDKIPGAFDRWMNTNNANFYQDTLFENLKVRAIRAFKAREEIAARTGVDLSRLNDFTREENLLTPKELEMPKFSGYRDSGRLRQLFSTVGSLDKFLLDYYTRWKAAPESERANVPLFQEEADMGAVLHEIESHENLATAGFTPLSMQGVGQRGLIKKVLFMFRNYPTRMFTQMARLLATDPRDPKGWREAYGWWSVIAVLIVSALAGMIGKEIASPIQQALTGRSPSYVKFSNVMANPDAGMVSRYVGMALASNLPYYGGVISQLLGNPGYGTWLDVAEYIPAAGLVKDAGVAVRRMAQTGDAILPGADFVGRWFPPASPALRLFPSVSGDIERRNAERALRVVGPSAGMELAGGGGGNAVQTPASAAVRRLISAAYRGDAQGIQAAFDEAVREKTEAGSADPERAVLQSLSSAVPARRVFGKSITPAEEAQMKGRMSGGQLSNYAEAQNAFDLINQTLGTSLSLTSTPRARSTTRGPATRRALFTDSATPIFAGRRSRRRRLGGRRRSAFRRLQIRGSSRRRRRSPARFSFAA